ncbi:hypothetical protein OS493_037715, partial [Desmophyllum pertusum]
MASRLVLYSSDSSLSDDGERSPPPDDFNQKPGPSNEFLSRSNYHESHKRVVLDVHSSDSNPEDSGPADAVGALFGAEGYRLDKKPEVRGMSISMELDPSHEDVIIPDLEPVSAEEEQPDMADQRENAELSGEEEQPDMADQRENAELSHSLPSSEAVQDDRPQYGAKRKAYALSMRDLPPGMRTFLAAVRKYFTQKVNLERQKAAVSETTYSKAEERILCYLGYVQKAMEFDGLNPDVFMRAILIEGYVHYLK